MVSCIYLVLAVVCAGALSYSSITDVTNSYSSRLLTESSGIFFVAVNAI